MNFDLTTDGDPERKRCIQIADKVVPEYRTMGRSYSCSGHHARRWQAAFQAATIATAQQTCGDE